MPISRAITATSISQHLTFYQCSIADMVEPHLCRSISLLRVVSTPQKLHRKTNLPGRQKKGWKLPTKKHPKKKETNKLLFFEIVWGVFLDPMIFWVLVSKTRGIPKRTYSTYINLALGEVDRKYLILRQPMFWKYFDPKRLYHICYNFRLIHSFISWGAPIQHVCWFSLTEIPFSSFYPVLKAEESYRHVIASLLSHQDIPQIYSHIMSP